MFTCRVKAIFVPSVIFVPNFCSFLIIRQKIKRSKFCFIPVISFKIGYVKHWLSQNFAQSISKMASEYTLENWGLKSLIDSRKLIFVNPMAVEKFADVKGTPCYSLKLQTPWFYRESWIFQEFSKFRNFSHFPLKVVNICPKQGVPFTSANFLTVIGFTNINFRESIRLFKPQLSRVYSLAILDILWAKFWHNQCLT